MTTGAGRRPTAARRAGLRHLPRGRTLHLVDIENLLGDPRAAGPAIAAAIEAYRSAMRVAPGDHVVIACNHGLAVDAGLAWPGARLRTGSGPDGADLALIDDADPAYVAAHYDRVVIGSGDGIFTGLAADLRALGTAVCVVARDGSLSRALRSVAGVAIELAA